jgi:transcriptional regulator of NAD metabolism
MKNQTKMSATARQQLIMNRLQQTEHPITGSEFATQTNVSRQVIVQDVSILKAKGKPIIATSQGYMLMNQNEADIVRSVIICNHTAAQTLEELQIIVDHGVTVKDVIVEHAVYGDITASIRVSNRAEVNHFVKQIDDSNATYLSTLTAGIHLHTLEAAKTEQIEAACSALKEAGILVD